MSHAQREGSRARQQRKEGRQEVRGEEWWLADKYGLSWQVTPAKFFSEWVKDPAGLQRVTHEVWQMRKLDLAKLHKAFAGT